MFYLNPPPRPLLDADKNIPDVNKLDYYIPANVPPEVMAYDSKIEQLGVGKAGKLGALILGLELDEVSHRTCVRDQYSRVPLYTQRALYLEETLPSMAYLYIISPSGGILQGDRYRIDIKLKNKALAHLTTQGATRIYRMKKNFATQIINVDVDEACYLEYIPDQIIPYRNSRFYQEVNLSVHDSATLVYSEMVTPGRVASGEHYLYDICYMKIVAKNQKERMRFFDVVTLEPLKRNIRTFGLLGNYDVFGTTYVLTEKKYIAELNEKVNLAINNNSMIAGGASILPRESGLLLRLLGNTANDLRLATFEVLKIVRKIVLGASFSGIRKG
jgi:urease accessory protein